MTFPRLLLKSFFVLVNTMVNIRGIKVKHSLLQVFLRQFITGVATLICMFVFLVGSSQAHEDFSSLVEKVLPAVVSLEVMTGSQTTNNNRPESTPEQWMDQFRNQPFMYDFFRRFFDEEFNNQNQGGVVENEEFKLEQVQYPRMGYGSGFIISADGKMVTNYHVIQDATDIRVRMADGDTVYAAEVLGSDPETDISVLQILEGEEFEFIQFGDSNSVKVGEPVLAIGNPLGVGISASKGIISAKYRTLNGPYDDFFQTDASINLGNSGGPLINLQGEVIGVNTAIKTSGFSRGSIGVGFSMSSAVASRVVDEILQTGKVSRGWLGIYISTSADEDGSDRIMVDGVFKDGPARKAGVLPGDLIVSVDSTEISNVRDFVSFVGKIEPGKEVVLEILRDKELISLEVILGDRPQTPSQIMSEEDLTDSDDILGMRFGYVPEKNTEYKFTNPETVVTDVANDSPAAKAGIKKFDQVEMVNSEIVITAKDIRKFVDEAVNNEDEKVSFFVIREGVLIKVEVDL